MNNKKYTKIIKALLVVVSCVIFLCCAVYFRQWYIDHIFEKDLGIFKYSTRDLISRYNSGEFGEELFYLTGFNTSGSLADIAVFIKDGKGVLHIYYYSSDRGWADPKELIEARNLSDEELEQFISFINDNNIDSLRNFHIRRPMFDRSSEYQYLHLSRDVRKSITIFYPDILRFDSDYYKKIIPEHEIHRSPIHADLLDQFFELAGTDYFGRNLR